MTFEIRDDFPVCGQSGRKLWDELHDALRSITDSQTIFIPLGVNRSPTEKKLAVTMREHFHQRGKRVHVIVESGGVRVWEDRSKR